MKRVRLNMLFKKNKFIYLFIIIVFGLFINTYFVFSAEPVGDDTFELTANPYTGNDNTGDGGTGNAGDLNYYYVGQSFTARMVIKSLTGSNGADLWIDFDTDYFSASNLVTGNYYDNWTGQSIDVGRVKSSAYNNPGHYSSGANGYYGSVQFTVLKPTAPAYGTGSPQTLDINVGVIGQTTESNISRDGVDILDDEEDFQVHIWADTIKPYAYNANPSNGANGVSVDSNYTFTLCDSKDGEVGDAGVCLASGVGTGVNTATPPGAITFDDGSGAVNYTAYDSYACSGTWGTNTCNVTINPSSPSGIAGDTRNWKYNTTYTVQISGFQDKASSAQNQLGDTNGPNTMDTKTWTFTTEADTVAPQVSSESPARGSTGVAVDTNIIIDIVDKKTYPNGPSGTGVNSVTCKINVSSASFPLTTFQQGDPEVTVAPISYGYRFTIDPAVDFGQNEVVSVSVYDCEDNASTPNKMVTDNWTFTTVDTDPPYVDNLNPTDNQNIDNDGVIKFRVNDDGVGVDLDETVIYVDGVYYTNGGGAGSVTTNGTKITFSSSLDFNGGNYVGDTTGIAGDSSAYTFTIDPENDFNDGEVIPIIIYTQDNSSNLMERYVYGLRVEDNCPGGNTYCGANTLWNGVMCVGDCPANPGGNTYCGANTVWNGAMCVGDCPAEQNCSGLTNGGSIITARIYNQTITQVDEQTIIVSWFSNLKGNSIVAYGLESPQDYGQAPNFDYEYVVSNDTEKVIYHSVVITNLKPETVYYFRPISKIGANYIRGEEMKMSTRYIKTLNLEFNPELCEQNGYIKTKQNSEYKIEDNLENKSIEINDKNKTIQSWLINKKTISNQIEIKGIEYRQGKIILSGKTKPKGKIKIIIY